jgi:hypothetical protein
MPKEHLCPGLAPLVPLNSPEFLIQDSIDRITGAPLEVLANRIGQKILQGHALFRGGGLGLAELRVGISTVVFIRPIFP